MSKKVIKVDFSKSDRVSDPINTHPGDCPIYKFRLERGLSQEDFALLAADEESMLYRTRRALVLIEAGHFTNWAWSVMEEVIELFADSDDEIESLRIATLDWCNDFNEGLMLRRKWEANASV